MRKIQQLSIDGINVELSKARFADTFDVAEGDERLLAFDEEVVYVVVARVSTPSFRESKHGEVSRVNVLKVKEARLVKDELYKGTLLDKTKFDYRPQPSLFDSIEESGSEDSVEALEAVGVKFPSQFPHADDVEERRSVNPPADDYGTLMGAAMASNWEAMDDSGPDDDMEKFLALTREIADEYEIALEPEPEPEPLPVGGSRKDSKVVADARGAAATDPVLARFLSQ